MEQFLPQLKDLAEGRCEPDAFLCWWHENASALEKIAKPGWFIRLKPRAIHNNHISSVILGCHEGACYILDALGLPYVRSNRYQQEWQIAFEMYQKQAAEARKMAAATFAPHIAALTKEFPKFGRWLKKNVLKIQTMSAGATNEQIQELESRIGAKLPAAYVRFLKCTRELSIESLDLRDHHIFIHQSPPHVMLPTHGLLCFGEYALDADGDAVLFDLRNGAPEDPPVIYYAHEIPEIRVIAPTFTAWLEKLPRSTALN